MASNPCVDALQHACRDPAFHGCFPAFLAKLPSGVPTDDASSDGAESQQPGISAVGDEQEQKQVCAPWDGQGNDGGVDYGNSKQAERAQAYEPVGKERAASRGSWGKQIHYEV